MISLMLGTVGLAYGSVPLYKMVCAINKTPRTKKKKKIYIG